MDETIGYYYYGARNYDATLGRWFNVDPLAELMSNYSPYVYTFNNPINLTDPTGMVPEEKDTDYKTSSGKTLLSTKDGNSDIITVPDDMVNDFKFYNESYQSGSIRLYDSQEWNDNIKATILGFETLDDMESYLGDFSTQWSRQNAIVYRQDRTIGNHLSMAFSEALSQWTDPEKLIIGAGILVGGMSPKTKGLGNQFKNRTLGEVEKAFEKHVKSSKLVIKPSAPGNKAFQNTKSKYS